LYLQPLYTGSSLSFAAQASLSVVVMAVDTPAIIDSMVALGASNISFIFTPDFFAGKFLFDCLKRRIKRTFPFF
jgi:hypothetical protein